MQFYSIDALSDYRAEYECVEYRLQYKSSLDSNWAINIWFFFRGKNENLLFMSFENI